MGPLESVGRDLRVALRSLARDAGFTVVVIATLSLGIGSAAAVFGLFNQLILRPLPGVPNSSAVAYLSFDSPLSDEAPPMARTNRGMAIGEFDELRRQATLLDGFASHRTLLGTASSGSGSPVQVLGSWIYGDYFEVLGATPAAGRLLTAEDNDLGSNPSVAVISERLAAALFPGDSDPVGQTFALDGRSFAVLGVAGGGFAGHERSTNTNTYDLWLPVPAQVHLYEMPSDEDLRGDSPSYRSFLIRPSPGVALEAVDEQLRAALGAMAPTSSRELDLFEPRISLGLNTPPSLRGRPPLPSGHRRVAPLSRRLRQRGEPSPCEKSDPEGERGGPQGRRRILGSRRAPTTHGKPATRRRGRGVRGRRGLAHHTCIQWGEPTTPAD